MKKSKRNKNILSLIGFLLVAGFLLFAFYSQSKIPPQDIGDVDANAKDISEEETKQTQNSISIPGYPNEIHLKKDEANTSIKLVNPEENNVYFKFTISLGEKVGDYFEEVETLYESGLVKPGQVIEQQELKRFLPVGSHEAAITVQTYSIDTKEEKNGARTMTNFVVE